MRKKKVIFFFSFFPFLSFPFLPIQCQINPPAAVTKLLLPQKKRRREEVRPG